MDFRLVLALWSIPFVPLVLMLLAGRGVDRALLWSIRGGIGILYFVPFVVTTDTIFPFVVGKALFTRGAIEIVFAMWVVLAIRRSEYRPARSWLTILFGTFVLASLVAAFTGVSFTRSFWSNYERMQGVLDLTHWFALLAVMLSVIRGRRQWLVVFNIIVGVGLVSAMLDVAQRYEPSVLRVLSESDRLTGTLGNATYVGAHMAIVAMLSIALLADSFTRGGGARAYVGRAGAKEDASPEAAENAEEGVRSRRQRGGRGLRVASRPRTTTQNVAWPGWVQKFIDEPERRIIWPVVYSVIWAIYLLAVSVQTDPYKAFLWATAATAFVTLLLVLGKERTLWAATTVLAIWVLGGSGSRGAAAAVGAGLVGAGIVYAVWGDRPRLRKLAAIGVVVLVIGAVVFAVGRQAGPVKRIAETNQLMNRFVNAGFTENARTVSARIALQAFAERPVTGWGPENFFIAFRKFQRADDFSTPPQNQDQTHDRPLEVLSGTGVVGFIPWVLMWTLVLVLAVRKVTLEKGPRLFAALMFGVVLAYLVHLLWLFEIANSILLFVSVAAWAGTAERAVAQLPEDVELPLPTAAAARPRLDRRSRRAGARPDEAPRTRILSREQVLDYVIPFAGLALIGLALFGMNHRIQRAAYLVVHPAPLDEIAPRLAAFSPLGTTGRTQFANAAASRMASVSESERTALISIATGEIEKAEEAEPSSIVVRLAAAHFFDTASAYQPELLARGRAETDRILELGPHTHEAHAQAIEQALLEKDLPAAQAAVEVWKTEHPDQSPADVNRYDVRLQALADQLAESSAGG